MRILLAALAIAALTANGGAQGMGGGGMGGKGPGGPPNGEQKVDPEKKKAIEEAYKSAVGRIPDSKQKYDPWKNAR